MAIVSSDTQQKLLNLRQKIEANLANLDDYKEYERLLTESGQFTSAEIKKRLQKFGYSDWPDYYKARQTNFFGSTNVATSNTEGAILGSILGLALAVILLSKLTAK